MLDDQNPALEAGDEVVQPEVEQAEAAEAPESTEGQEEIQPAEGEAEGEQPETESEEEVSESKKRRERRKAYQRELQEKADRAERELAEHKESQERIQEAAKAQQPPKEADFQDYQEYLMAAGAWQAGQQFDKRRVEEIQSKAEASSKELEALRQQQQAEAQENWDAQSVDARGRYKDFDAVISAPDAAFTQSISDLVKSSDMGADVAYYLGTHKAELRELAGMSPIEQAKVIGRLEATIQAPKPRTQSSAPEPVSAVRPKGTATSAPEDLPTDEYRQWRASGGTF